ncbi:prepilin-type N-terminal cleavage/methylation domain-containing protein [Paenibacillus kobensis]|uniref:prepilin-type N-terminal cleavage/methylation domain-containing protein n=1 Tax=Paenibacillus kobensis TaxID=59841 RepID=UPI000FDA7A6E|nr:prepilin-type N-terminal cleavage/methylation domain-containing protein [Paenibacillus kobensis]
METAVQSGKSMLKNKKGLTLIELLAIIVIIGIIAAIAIPAVNNMISKSKTSSDAATDRIVQEAAVRYGMDNTVTDDQEINITELQTKGYLTTLPDWNDTAKKKTKVTFNIDANGVITATLTK